MKHGEYKTPGGKLTVVDFNVFDEKITNFSLSGDFFLEPEETLFVINAALEGASAKEPAATYANIVTQSLTEDLSEDDVVKNVTQDVVDGVAMLGTSADAIGIAIRRALSNANQWRDLEWEIIVGEELPPAVNVALDEVLTREVGAGRRGPTMRIWEWNDDAVIIGSFQSVKNEVDEAEANALNTKIIRRISGGGAMYMQPEASITYSLYAPVSFVSDISFEESYQFLDEWVLEALHTMGVAATYEPLNDITGPSGKIGGAAQKRLASGALLHHVTMAYDMDAEKMTRVLRIGREKMSDKGTKSAAKRVDPLRSQTGLSRAEIIERMAAVFTARHSATLGHVSDTELEDAKELAESKFLADEWVHRIP